MNVCTPSPCGSNAVCTDKLGIGYCSCIAGYSGDPYFGCRPECVLNSDCSWNKACVNNKCQNPCLHACGLNAECNVVHHIAICTCLPKYTGDPLSACRHIEHIDSKHSPCMVRFCLHVHFAEILYCKTTFLKFNFETIVKYIKMYF